MIEVIDKTNRKIKSVPDDTEVIIGPKGNTIYLEDYQMEGMRIYGIIHKENGSTLFLYKNIKEKKEELKRKIEESDIFLVMLDESYLTNPKCLEKFLYAKICNKPMIILEENNALSKFPALIEGCNIILKLPLTKESPTHEELEQKIKEALKKRK